MKKIVSLLTAVVALWGCSDDLQENIIPDGNYDPSKVITIAPITTKGTMINSEAQMSSIGVFCSSTGLLDWTTVNSPTKMFNTRLDRSTSGQWVYSGTPVNWNTTTPNDKFTFFSYAPFATGNYDASNNPNGNGIIVNGSSSTPGIPTITYTVPSNSPSQPDLMVSLIRKNIIKTSSPVNLSMRHALTSVGFKMIGNGQQISKVTIKGVKSVGTLAVQGDTIIWTNVSGNSDLDVKLTPGITLSPTGQQVNSSDGYMMMIPQTLTSNAKISVTLQGGAVREANLNTQVWQAGKHVDYVMTITDQGIITVSPATLLIPSLGEPWGYKIINVTCNDPNMNWTLTSTDSWLHLSANSNGSSSGQSVSGQGTAAIYVKADPNTTGADRSTTITLAGGVVVSITQLRNINLTTILSNVTPPTGVTTYVGAYWRAGQTGERIIRISTGTAPANLGEWRASVAWVDGSWADGDIVLSTDLSVDSNVDFTSTKTPGNAESFPVLSNSCIATGNVTTNGSIYFRIGLKSTYTPTDIKPARYALILLQYGGIPYKEQLIYLRQGHDPDYLMRTNETGTPGSTLASRPNAVRFSPYNLTATNMSDGGTLVTDHTPLNILTNKGTFTEYPTQAGAFFQWASTDFVLYAYNPVNPLGNITGWSILYPVLAWTAGLAPLRLIDTQEGCPQGYSLSYGSNANFRRPNDGVTDVNVSSPAATSSEMAQSLWLAPPANNIPDVKNFVWGYYADGFFDRRMLESTTAVTNGRANSAVRWNYKDVAYAGGLFFNPVTNASIFFPSAGYRSATNPTNGALNYSGSAGFYLSSSSRDTDNDWQMFNAVVVTTPSAARLNGYKSNGRTIRCVRN